MRKAFKNLTKCSSGQRRSADGTGAYVPTAQVQQQIWSILADTQDRRWADELQAEEMQQASVLSALGVPRMGGGQPVGAAVASTLDTGDTAAATVETSGVKMRYPPFAPPMENVYLGYRGSTVPPNTRNALWELFWQCSVESQIESFLGRPNMFALLEQFEGQDLWCIRDPTTKEAWSETLAFVVPNSFPRFDEEDPYFTVQDWVNREGHQALAHLKDQVPERVVKVEVGPTEGSLNLRRESGSRTVAPLTYRDQSQVHPIIHLLPNILWKA